MKRTASIFTLSVLALLAGEVSAQIETPAASPLATIKQNVGLMEVAITYSRPGVNERVIFGDLVPYGEVWRTGANQSTKITLSDTVLLEGNLTPPGAYTLATIPGKDEWTIIINKNSEMWGVYEYKAEDDLLRFTVPAQKTQKQVETMTIGFSDLTWKGANVNISWENTLVSFNLEHAGIADQIMASINTTLGGGEASANDYFAAATFMYNTDQDLEKAAKWVNTAVEKYEAQNRNVFWVYHQKAKILSALGNYSEAIKAAEKSKEMAREANNQDYIKLNDKVIAEWKAKK